MSWLFGIPDFVGLFTYYDSLDDTSQNTPIGAERKKYLADTARATLKNSASALSLPKNINDANIFLKKVAINERNKEITLIEKFCEETKNTFPNLQPFLTNPASIEKNPEGFYAQLTAAINQARKGTQEYLDQLQRIKRNIHSAEKRTLKDYKEDDYRYRLSGDIQSFLNRITGKYQAQGGANEILGDEFSTKVQNLTLKILENSDMFNRIKDGEDFAAVATAVLIDVEQKVQKEIDKEIKSGKRTSRIIDKTANIFLDDIEQHYKDIFDRKISANSPVEQLLKNLNPNALDLNRIVINTKKILGISTEEVRLIELEDRIKQLKEKDSKLSENNNKGIKMVRDKISQYRRMYRDLNLVNFSISGSANSKHGTIYELIESLDFGKQKIGSEVGTDILSYTFHFDTSLEKGALDTLLNNISNEYVEFYNKSLSLTAEDAKHLKENLQAANERIDKLIKQTEDKLKKQKDYDKDQKFFVYHETLKLYSSAETGNAAHEGFGGRTLNILNYIDYLYSLDESFNFPIDKKSMGILGLNLGPGTLGKDYKDPLEQYLSMYAGMIMFDDLANMAKEATGQLDKTNSNIVQIHLYNLNGLYVPASMMLSYIADVTEKATTIINDGSAAKATISVPSSNKAYERWKNGEAHGKGTRTYIKNELRPEHWYQVAEDSKSHTKVKITFLATFKRFIEMLPYSS